MTTSANNSQGSVIAQPEWFQPKPKDPVADLKVYNSLTKKKDVFVPAEGRNVGWYSCGPTVYDASHMGHARAYITFDILRRIMSDYFGYDILYVMNITDIDDKIILGARYHYLFQQYIEKAVKGSITKPDLVKESIAAWSEFVNGKFAKLNTNGTQLSLNNFSEFMKSQDTEKGREVVGEKYDLFVKTATKTHEILSKQSTSPDSITDVKAFLEPLKDILAPYLDKQFGATITDPKIFRDFAGYWETEFFNDMRALNVLEPDVLTRVSEYVDDIVEYVAKIIDNGYAYESEGSVYFHTQAFDSAPNHCYAKLEPWSKNNTKLAEEGEGALSTALRGKRASSDFALWKASKPGEPAWPSPWGMGRPGWHIECSVMASRVLGESLDIHSGGIDLAFPHHDNEMAQAEGYYNCKQWVNYFLHAGHLHIEGQKMSKSLKNFITIKEALAKYSAGQIRLMFLLHNWDSVLDYKEASMMSAISYETMLMNFFQNAKALINEAKAKPYVFTGKHNYHDSERELMAILQSTQTQVHSTLCDSFNTPMTLQALSNLITKTNIYIAAKNKDITASVNEQVLEKIYTYIDKTFRMFGVLSDSNNGKSGDLETQLFPYLQALSDFRGRIRDLARNKADSVEFLKAADFLRDVQLFDLGVSLDDREDGTATIKIVDKETLMKQREEKKQREMEKQLKKLENARKAAEKKLEKLTKGATVPSELFRDEEGVKLYKTWDENGIPTHEINGEEVSKSKRKKLQKEYDTQIKLHEEYKAFVASGGRLDLEYLTNEGK